jgi:AcrR family transcriptional regulator
MTLPMTNRTPQQPAPKPTRRRDRPDDRGASPAMTADHSSTADHASPANPSATSQRERLLNGMAKAVAKRGYAQATVAQAIAQAGVSRSTFYEHFADKEECFLATCEALAPVLSGELLEAVGDVPWEERQRAMLSVVLDPSSSETAMHWRLLLTQARAGEPRIRAQRARFAAQLEGAFEALLDAPPRGAPTLDIPAKALLGGVRSVVSIQRYTHGAEDQDRLLDDLETWTASYAVPAGYERRDGAAWLELGQRLRAGPPRDSSANGRAGAGAGLPRGRSRLPANVVAGEHHRRIVQATAETMRAKGYAAATIADIVAAAGTSRGVFYEQFQNKQEAFLAAQTVTLQKGLTAASAAFFTGRTWPEQVWNGLDALLGFLAEVPDLAHLMLIEPYAAGRAAQDRVIDTMRTLSLFLEEGYHRGSRAELLPRTCSDAIAGAIHELLYDAAERERVEELRELLPQAVYVALAPFLGPVRARETVDELAAASASGTARVGARSSSG